MTENRKMLFELSYLILLLSRLKPAAKNVRKEQNLVFNQIQNPSNHPTFDKFANFEVKVICHYKILKPKIMPRMANSP